jgi:hypothetical protein
MAEVSVLHGAFTDPVIHDHKKAPSKRWGFFANPLKVIRD